MVWVVKKKQNNQDLPSARTLPCPAPNNLDLENTGSIFLKQLLLLSVCKIILQESVGLAAFQEVVTVKSSRRQIELKMGSYNTYSEWWGLDVLTIKWQRHQENTLIIRMSIHRHHHMYQYSSNSIIMIVILTMHVLVILLEMCLCYMVTCYQVSMTPAGVYNTCAQVLWTPARRCYCHKFVYFSETCLQVRLWHRVQLLRQPRQQDAGIRKKHLWGIHSARLIFHRCF